MKLIKQGAEAKLFLDKYHDMNVIIKNRIKKNYRIPQIDTKIRKERTKQESTLLSEARRVGVNTPQILKIEEHKIIMEYIQGVRAKEYLYSCSKSQAEDLMKCIGRNIGKLHLAGIIHGDLTTSNIIIREGRIYFIDFGLGFFSKRIEDQGTDLRLIKEALRSTHFEILNMCWNSILEGYRKEYKDGEKVIRKVAEIEKRVRYA